MNLRGTSVYRAGPPSMRQDSCTCRFDEFFALLVLAWSESLLGLRPSRFPLYLASHLGFSKFSGHERCLPASGRVYLTSDGVRWLGFSIENGEIDGFSFQRQVFLPRLRLTGDLMNSVPVERHRFDEFF